MAKDKDIDATFCIENEDLGNWVISLMEEFIENDDLNDYIFSSLPEDSKLSDEQAEGRNYCQRVNELFSRWDSNRHYGCL